ncbi:MAG: glucose-1-phosphate adenylyltransferase [Anaerolineae bacterium]|nr:glucose-1-phosphate adenylyltransferase [Anaerolineae bacterium]
MKNITDQVLALVLGGGVDSGLYPLTQTRSKPAVSLCGKYRLIDITLSNCINSRIYHIAVLTQFNSISLHRHLSSAYNLDAFHRGGVQIWAADQTNVSHEWYLGTADAVRKKLGRVLQLDNDYVIILGADHLYRMDYGAMMDFHLKTNADITVAALPVDAEDTHRFGILKLDDCRRVVDFVEKPRNPAVLSQMVSYPDQQKPFIGSMGIYIFNTQVLIDLLSGTSDKDFGKDVLPHAIHEYNVFAYDFTGYWEDIGTIRSYYETNLKLASRTHPFNFYDPDQPIYTSQRYLPGSIVENSHLEETLLTEGCIIKEAYIKHSVIGLRSRICPGARISDSILFGADYYLAYETNKAGEIPTGIGEKCIIEGAILDKNVRMGPYCVVRPFPRGFNFDTENWVIRDGIVIFPKGATISAGTVITPDTVPMFLSRPK